MKDWSLVGIVIGVVIILGIGICEQQYLENLSYDMVKNISDIEGLVISGDIEVSLVKLQNIIAKWEKDEEVLGIMINHQDTRKISEALIEIESKLKKFSNSDNVSANFAILKEYIIGIKEGNEFTTRNIL